ncbi:peptidylprolyl isomerase [Mangrovimicrobium sediminis]|nr:peptidylprolyl isomerase [Haliea sp. SAOS-164]
MLKAPIFPILFALVLPAFASAQQVVVEDEGVSLSADELAYHVSKWSPQMREAALDDDGDRLELVNMVMMNKKLAATADPIVAENPELAMEYQEGLEAYKRNFILRHYRDTLELPDFSKLAKERYETEKDKYALVPEHRVSSQILIKSPPGIPRDDALAEAADVLEQLRAGADFLEMVKEHSDEPGAVEKEGKFNRWIKYGEIGVAPRYSEGLFTIGKVGEFAEPVQTQFGVHIIRLDGIREAYYKTFEEVEPAIVQDLADEYVKLSLKDYVTKYNLTDQAVVDDAAVLEILAPYAQPPAGGNDAAEAAEQSEDAAADQEQAEE